ncbi:unnamed protein product, partial [Amoebophrya sp. A25]
TSPPEGGLGVHDGRHGHEYQTQDHKAGHKTSSHLRRARALLGRNFSGMSAESLARVLCFFDCFPLSGGSYTEHFCSAVENGLTSPTTARPLARVLAALCHDDKRTVDVEWEKPTAMPGEDEEGRTHQNLFGGEAVAQDDEGATSTARDESKMASTTGDMPLEFGSSSGSHVQVSPQIRERRTSREDERGKAATKIMKQAIRYLRKQAQQCRNLYELENETSLRSHMDGPLMVGQPEKEPSQNAAAADERVSAIKMAMLSDGSRMANKQRRDTVEDVPPAVKTIDDSFPVPPSAQAVSMILTSCGYFTGQKNIGPHFGSVKRALAAARPDVE